ncbi:glutamate--cysteine ligase [Aestuariirhabdus litorea]|uniref:Glutamate--cysteine ligase n=1 Tax=Aestuariirhabdus litorea TaxID=2528527 RepID=A0A3P3VIA8_9GAMM|nr:glutamate--cysteine ligase [Aestuariirhabdus litorea]RRJ82460.1 glutamate--cysteine ligase [Aestuariirhabdus litorea]RWW92621.1 glutamate--cysteine ligase [Endozoicomonadaceae bacterium GTF-13]
MPQLSQQILHLFRQPEAREQLTHILHGIEKESLRATAQASLAQTPHPRALGSTLTHPSITTDYSEALLEFITPVYERADQALEHLRQLHCYTYRHIGDEMLWVNSMPCRLEGESNIPIAYYGTSNVGRMKYVYREGLANRYNKAMQTIAGIHYNFSLPEGFWRLLQQHRGEQGSLQTYQSRGYFRLIRNFRRYSWLLIYLFGASPALSRSFLEARPNDLESLDADTLYRPWATSLRMSDLGYQSNAQSSLKVCFNGLETYTATLREAISTPYAPYQKIGLKDNEGHYRQLNTNLLQIENEYYSSIRPKRVTQSGEKPVCALTARGVEYIEVRCLDLNPFSALGISVEQCHFLDAFLLFCALADSPLIDDEECIELDRNYSRVINEGRRPGLTLSRQGQPIEVKAWALRVIEQVAGAAGLLDEANNTRAFSASLMAEKAKVEDPSLTPSAQVLAHLQNRSQSFIEFGIESALEHRASFSQCHLDEAQRAELERMAEQSLEEQRVIEEQDSIDFDTYLEHYFAQT